MTDRQKRTVQVENLTGYPDGEVKRIARWAAREAGINEAYGESAHRVLIRVAHHTGYHPYQGRWYRHASSHGTSFYVGRGVFADVEVKVPPGIHHLALCRVAKPGAWSSGKPKNHNHHLRGGPPDIVIENWQQSLVAIVAHECTHGWMDANRLRRRNAGRAKHSEVECEWAEYRILERFKQKEAAKHGTV